MNMATKPVGWKNDPARHSLAAKGVTTGSKRVFRKATIEARLPDLTRVEVAENAIRDMFLSKQYDEAVPCEDVSFILNSPRWYSLYGKKDLKEAWDFLVKEGYVHREGNYWVWGLE